MRWEAVRNDMAGGRKKVRMPGMHRERERRAETGTEEKKRREKYPRGGIEGVSRTGEREYETGKHWLACASLNMFFLRSMIDSVPLGFLSERGTYYG